MPFNQATCMVIDMAAKIIHAAGYINKLAVAEAFAHFFYGAMDIAQVRFYFFDGFTIEGYYKM